MPASARHQHPAEPAARQLPAPRPSSHVARSGPAPSAFYTLPYTTLFRSPLQRAAAPAWDRNPPTVPPTASRAASLPAKWSRRKRARRLPARPAPTNACRSEEHTSELQSLRPPVCRLLLDTSTQQSPRRDSCRLRVHRRMLLGPVLRPPRSTLFPTRRSSDLLFSELQRQLGIGTRQLCRQLHLELLLFLRNGRAGSGPVGCLLDRHRRTRADRKSTRLNSSHLGLPYAGFCSTPAPSRARGATAAGSASIVACCSVRSCALRVLHSSLHDALPISSSASCSASLGSEPANCAANCISSCFSSCEMVAPEAGPSAACSTGTDERVQIGRAHV